MKPVKISLRLSILNKVLLMCVCVYVYINTLMCVYICVCRVHISIHRHTHTHISVFRSTGKIVPVMLFILFDIHGI